MLIQLEMGLHLEETFSLVPGRAFLTGPRLDLVGKILNHHDSWSPTLVVSGSWQTAGVQVLFEYLTALEMRQNEFSHH